MPEVNWTPPPPGSTEEQLPAHILEVLPKRSYLSSACQTARTMMVPIIQYPDRPELKEWMERLHRRCRTNHKFTGALCYCNCHTDEEER